MGEIKEFTKVNLHTIKTKMEHILTLLEEGIGEAHEKGEKMKAESCLGAIYKELISQYEQLLDNQKLYLFYSELMELLERDEEYAKKHIAMTEEEIYEEYVEYLNKCIEEFPKIGITRLKIQDKLQKETPSKEELIEYAKELTNGKLHVHACIMIVEQEMQKFLMAEFGGFIENILNELDSEEYNEGD